MSFYRKFAGEALNEVSSTVTPQPKDKSEVERRADAAREEAEKHKRSKGTPSSLPLPRTLTWAASLPEDVRPHELLRTYGRIANLIAASWNDPEATYSYLDELLVDRRGNRQGFPPSVMSELLALRTHYAGLHVRSTGTWMHIYKR
jgi:hypothetical protein